MEKKLVTIHSTSPDHEWIQKFETSLIKKGLDATTINSFNRCLRETGNNFNESQELFSRLNADTVCRIHLLLAPERHKHYIRSIVETTRALHEDEGALAVYDMNELPDDSDFLASVLSVESVINQWKEIAGSYRVLSRDEAMVYLQTILPLRLEVAQSMGRMVTLPITKSVANRPLRAISNKAV